MGASQHSTPQCTGTQEQESRLRFTLTHPLSSYIFKRLKFLGNKELSQGLSLLFLALWHGLHSGYLICFQMEFLIVIVEKQV